MARPINDYRIVDKEGNPLSREEFLSRLLEKHAPMTVPEDGPINLSPENILTLTLPDGAGDFRPDPLEGWGFKAEYNEGGVRFYILDENEKVMAQYTFGWKRFKKFAKLMAKVLKSRKEK